MNIVTLREWETADPDSNPGLRGLFLADPSATALARQLRQEGRVEILEMRDGLRIRSTSFIGFVGIGGLSIRIQPKLELTPLSRLLRYALGLRDLRRFQTEDQPANETGIVDLLCLQLATEAEELISRGLIRRYVRRHEVLEAPRGRIDIQRLATRGSSGVVGLDCVHHPRHEDSPHNRLLLAGLRLATDLTESMNLKTRLFRLTKFVSVNVTSIHLGTVAFANVRRNASRLTSAYSPAISLIEALWRGHGISWKSNDVHVRVPGFLFDMNRFWQSLIARFLDDHLFGYEVRADRGLIGMVDLRPGFNPYVRRAPSIRPDFVVCHGLSPVAILDAKYRDLIATPMPREMLYQLSVYALAGDKAKASVILFPSTAANARETRYIVREPFGHGRTLAEVILRPVDVSLLDDLLADRSIAGPIRRSCLATALVFGEPRAETSEVVA